MTNQPGPANDESSRDNKLMFVAVFVIALIIVGGMGINMLVHKETNASTVETTSPPQ